MEPALCWMSPEDVDHSPVTVLNAGGPSQRPLCVYAYLLQRHPEQHVVESFHETSGVNQLPTLGQHGLIEQDAAPVIELRVLIFQTLNQRVIRVDLEDGLAIGRFLTRGFQHAKQIAR